MTEAASAPTAGRLTLRPVREDDEAVCRRAHEELAADAFEFLLEDPEQPWPAYVRRLDEVARGVDLAPGRVAMTFRVADVGGQVVGRTSVRHELTEWLARYGGHIGYGVRPAYRRRGYATEILRRSLAVARGVGIREALLVCDNGNLGSAAVIERCGGRLDAVAPGPEGHGPIRRYWVPTS
ncbi:MAG TPA: GNAT family N-acetyltransferase [Mycobacteriales bacterium]